MKILSSIVIFLLVFSCQLPKSSIPESSPKDFVREINEKYPLWRVYAEGFEAQASTGGISEEEIKFILQAMADLRTIFSTQEFKDKLAERKFYIIYLAVKPAQIPDWQWNVFGKEDRANCWRVADTFRGAESSVIFVKKAGAHGNVMWGDLGGQAYVYMDTEHKWTYGKRIYLADTTWNETCFGNNYYKFLSGLAHEYSHLLGYGHYGGSEGDVAKHVELIVSNNAKTILENNSVMREELRKYYLTFLDKLSVTGGTSGSGGADIEK